MRVAALELSRAPLDPLLLVFDGLPSGSTAEAGPRDLSGGLHLTERCEHLNSSRVLPGEAPLRRTVRCGGGRSLRRVRSTRVLRAGRTRSAARCAARPRRQRARRRCRPSWPYRRTGSSRRAAPPRCQPRCASVAGLPGRPTAVRPMGSCEIRRLPTGEPNDQPNHMAHPRMTHPTGLRQHSLHDRPEQEPGGPCVTNAKEADVGSGF
jgi:hypothetical protein